MPGEGGAFDTLREFADTAQQGQITHVDVYFGSETGEPAAEEEIRTVVEAWAEGIRQKDVEAVAR